MFIGQGLDEAGLRARLDACLLDPTLAAADSAAWEGLPNPFPPLLLDEDGADEEIDDEATEDDPRPRHLGA